MGVGRSSFPPAEAGRGTAQNSPSNPVFAALGALGLLSVVPLPRRAHGLPTAVTLATFALAGLALGGAAAGLDLALAPVLSAAARSAVIVVALVAVSGAMHLDGLMDAADGLFGGRTIDRRLEIMRDSRVGAFGVSAALLTVLVEYAALASIASARPVALVVACAVSRAASALALGVAQPARADGLGNVFTVRRRLVGGLLAMGMATIAAAVLGGLRGGAAVVVSLVVAAGVMAIFRRRVGGMTGDGFGAVVELSFAGALLCFAAR